MFSVNLIPVSISLLFPYLQLVSVLLMSYIAGHWILADQTDNHSRSSTHYSSVSLRAWVFSQVLADCRYINNVIMRLTTIVPLETSNFKICKANICCLSHWASGTYVFVFSVRDVRETVCYGNVERGACSSSSDRAFYSFVMAYPFVLYMGVVWNVKPLMSLAFIVLSASVFFCTCVFQQPRSMQSNHRLLTDSMP